MPKVVIAEDNEPLANAIAMLLESYGYEVSIAHDGEAALTQITRLLPKAALLDLEMPLMDGVTVAIRSREVFGRALRLVALTARSDDETRQDVAGAGFDGLLVKPASIYQILNAIGHGEERATA